ncbi:MAG: hypothetical protein ABIK31_01685 [candidate division WOR-3 bacterium]
MPLKIVRILIIMLFAVLVIKIGVKFNSGFYSTENQTYNINKPIGLSSHDTISPQNNFKYNLPNGVKYYISSVPISVIIDSSAIRESIIGNKVEKTHTGPLSLLMVRKANGDIKMLFGYPAIEKGKWIVIEKNVSSTIQGYLTEENSQELSAVAKDLPNYPDAFCRFFMDMLPNGFIAILNNDSSINTTESFYRKEMQQKGWSLLKDTSNIYIYQKNDVLCALNILPDTVNNHSKINVVVIKQYVK